MLPPIERAMKRKNDKLQKRPSKRPSRLENDAIERAAFMHLQLKTHFASFQADELNKIIDFCDSMLLSC